MALARRLAETHPDKPAYIMAQSGETVSFSQLERRANRCCHYFRDIGLQPKAKIAVFMENHPKYLEIIRAAHVAGLQYVAISTHFKRSEVEYIINDSEAVILVTSLEMRATAEAIIDDMPKVKHRLMVDGTVPGYDSFEEAVADYPTTPIPECIYGAAVLYSSGTTGRPKGVVNKVEDTMFGTTHPSVSALFNAFGFNEESVFLSPAPLYHVSPLRFSLNVIQFGGTVIIMEKFGAEHSLTLIDNYKVTHTQWVPTMFIRCLKLPEETRNQYDVSSLKVCIHGAAPCPLEVKEQMMAWWGPVLVEFYSGTEANTLVVMPPNEWKDHRGSVGKSILGILHILDDDDHEVPVRTPGYIFVENGDDFEYLNDPEKTTASRSSQGWTTIGDIGYLDEDGYLYLTDRKDYTIISGGVNIYPQEIENLLSINEKVLDVAVFGVPNEDFGEEVKAVVQPASMADAGPELEQELIAYCRENLSNIKSPKSIDFRAELPRIPTGKLKKRVLKDEYWAGHK